MNLILIVLAFLAPTANAAIAPSAAASKWQFADETDAYLAVPVCRAFTQATTSKEPIELSFAYPKEGKLVPMIGLRTKLAPIEVALKISATETENFYLLKAGATNADVSYLWYAPVNVARFEQIVRDRSSLDLVLDPKGAKTPVSVSLVGSSNALDQAAKCLKGTAGANDFFKLLNAQKDNLTPDLGDRTPLFLFHTVQAAFEAYRAGQAISLDLATLRKANAPLLSRESAAQATLKSAQSARDAADAKLKTAQTQVSTLSAQLEQAKSTLAALQAEKPVDEADLAKKKATYLPLKAQMAPYDKAIVDAAAKVKSIAGSIAANEALIDKNTKRIPQLENESASLTRQLPGLRSRVNSTRSAYDDADYKYRQYDVSRETRDQLDRDAQYGWAKSDVDRYTREVQQDQSEVNSAQSAVSSAESALNSCKAQPNANCSSQDQALNQARANLSAREATLWGAQNSLNRAKSDMQSREDDIKRKVQNESDDLRRKRDDAESEYNTASGNLTDAQNRIAEIRNAIPALKAQIEKAQAALPGLRDQLTAANAALDAANAARAAFSAQIDFGTAESEYLAAVQKLSDAVAGIAKATKEIPQLTKSLALVTKTVPGLTNALAAADAALTKAQAVLAPLEEQLKPFHEAQAAKLAALDAESTKFKNGRAAYQDLLKILAQ